MSESKYVGQCVIDEESILNMHELRFGKTNEMLVGLNEEEPQWKPITVPVLANFGYEEPYVEFGDSRYNLGDFL